MDELPTGTVTFLFSDIEGSTRLLQHLGEAYGGVLAEQRRVVRDACARHGGSEVDTQGDAFFLAFPSAGAAVACAAEVQRALAGHDWPDGIAVRVRMGVHTGEPVVTVGGYVGLDVHRAARVCAAGHGGQVLLSQAAADVARSALPSGATLRDLGEHHLKDLQRPERLFQLVLPDLPAEFAPLRAPKAHAHNLPTEPTSLLGREREVAAIRELVTRERARLVTLTGPGGIGKTRLAAAAATELADLHADGVFFVALATVADPRLVAATLAQTLGVREVGGRSAAESVRAFLDERRVLLVLDNFEQVVEAAPLMADLLAGCPGVTLLVTSREPLHVRGEQEYAVQPLELPERPGAGGGRGYDVAQIAGCAAVALFVARARAVKADFELTQANADAVAEVCRRLDGLPLALELAAARVKLLSPQAMARRLANGLDLLTSAARDLPDRQRTLRGAIDWSYDLLTPDERRMFRRFSVFAAGARLEAAEAVCGISLEEDPSDQAGAEGASDLLETLGSLVDKSLIRQQEGEDGEPRFTMLETLRLYSAERLRADGEDGRVRRAHAGYYLALAERAEPHLTGQNQRHWLDLLDQEHDNVRAALGWARDLGDGTSFARLVGAVWRFWYTHGYLTEGQRWLDEVIARGMDGLPAALRAKVLYGGATLASTHGDRERTVALGGASLAEYRACGDKAGTAGALNLLGIVALNASDIAEARRLFEEGLALCREVGDPWGTARILLSLGQCAYREGELQQADGLLEECVALLGRLGSVSNLAVALLNLGHVARAAGDLARATVLYRQALGLSRDVGDSLRVVRDLEALALAAAERGEAERAARIFGAAEALREELGTTRHPVDGPAVERALADLRARLGEEMFAALRAEGAALPEERAVEEAMGG